MIPRKKSFAVFRELYDWVESGLTAILAVVLVFTFVIRMVEVRGDSMYPTLANNNRLIAATVYGNVKEGSVKSGDIVVITKPNSRNEPLIKRVIAVEGQTIDIDIDTGIVYVNGQELYEPYIAEQIYPGSGFGIELPQVVPRGHIFVMGDNRNHSWDSREAAVGMIDARHVLGKVVYRVWPYEDFGKPG